MLDAGRDGQMEHVTKEINQNLEETHSDTPCTNLSDFGVLDIFHNKSFKNYIGYSAYAKMSSSILKWGITLKEMSSVHPAQLKSLPVRTACTAH